MRCPPSVRPVCACRCGRTDRTDGSYTQSITSGFAWATLARHRVSPPATDRVRFLAPGQCRSSGDFRRHVAAGDRAAELARKPGKELVAPQRRGANLGRRRRECEAWFHQSRPVRGEGPAPGRWSETDNAVPRVMGMHTAMWPRTKAAAHQRLAVKGVPFEIGRATWCAWCRRTSTCTACRRRRWWRRLGPAPGPRRGNPFRGHQSAQRVELSSARGSVVGEAGGRGRLERVVQAQPRAAAAPGHGRFRAQAHAHRARLECEAGMLSDYRRAPAPDGGLFAKSSTAHGRQPVPQRPAKCSTTTSPIPTSSPRTSLTSTGRGVPIALNSQARARKVGPILDDRLTDRQGAAAR